MSDKPQIPSGLRRAARPAHPSAPRPPMNSTDQAHTAAQTAASVPSAVHTALQREISHAIGKVLSRRRALQQAQENLTHLCTQAEQLGVSEQLIDQAARARGVELSQVKKPPPFQEGDA